MAKKAVFFDRDGVLNDVIDRGEDFVVKGKKVRYTGPYNHNEFRLRPGLKKILDEIGSRGFLRVLVTNQPDIAYGIMDPSEHERIMQDIRKLPLDDIYVCPHGRDDKCLCKKPLPGMLHTAAKNLDIDLESSYLVGDTKNDLDAAKAAGVRSILISDGRNHDLKPDYRVENLSDILEIIK